MGTYIGSDDCVQAREEVTAAFDDTMRTGAAIHQRRHGIPTLRVGCIGAGLPATLEKFVHSF